MYFIETTLHRNSGFENKFVSILFYSQHTHTHTQTRFQFEYFVVELFQC